MAFTLELLEPRPGGLGSTEKMTCSPQGNEAWPRLSSYRQTENDDDDCCFYYCYSRRSDALACANASRRKERERVLGDAWL